MWNSVNIEEVGGISRKIYFIKVAPGERTWVNNCGRNGKIIKRCSLNSKCKPQMAAVNPSTVQGCCSYEVEWSFSLLKGALIGTVAVNQNCPV